MFMLVVAEELGIHLQLLHEVEGADVQDLAEIDLGIGGKIDDRERVQTCGSWRSTDAICSDVARSILLMSTMSLNATCSTASLLCARFRSRLTASTTVTNASSRILP